MKSALAAIRSLVLPYGAISGTRIILDGVNGRIDVYDATNQLVARLDGDGLFIETDDGYISLSEALGLLVNADTGSYVRTFTLPAGTLTGGGAAQAYQPADVPGRAYLPGYVFANSFATQNDAPALQLQSPQLDSPVRPQALIILLGEDGAGNPPLIDHRAPGGRHRFLSGDVEVRGHLVDEDGIGFPVVQQGTQSMEIIAPGTFLETVVTFPVPFDTVPKVMTNINGNSGLYARWGSRAHTITTTGFKLFMFAVNPTTNANDFIANVDWVATAIS